MEVILKDVPMYFEALYTPRAMANDPTSKPAYGARYVIVPGSENDKAIQAAIAGAATAQPKWKGKEAEIVKKLKDDRKCAYVEGEYLNKDGVPYEGFEGSYSLGTRSEKLKPTVKNRFNADVVQGDPGAPYAGCRVHAAVDIWCQDNGFGRRINAVTQGVMFVGDGVPVGGGRPASDSTFAGMASEPTTADLV